MNDLKHIFEKYENEKKDKILPKITKDAKKNLLNLFKTHPKKTTTTNNKAPKNINYLNYPINIQEKIPKT